jgi:flagellar protein FlbD
MIKLTRLGGRSFYLNSDLIESFEAVPDTTLLLSTGRRVIVTENPEEVVRRIIEFRRDIFYKYPDERLASPSSDNEEPRQTSRR